jgi:hypothetical protein
MSRPHAMMNPTAMQSQTNSLGAMPSMRFHGCFISFHGSIYASTISSINSMMTHAIAGSPYSVANRVVLHDKKQRSIYFNALRQSSIAQQKQM